MLLWILRGCYGALILGTGLFVLETFSKADAFATGLVAFAAIVTIGVLTAEVVSAATDMVGKDGQVTITSVGRGGDTQIALAANGQQ